MDYPLIDVSTIDTVLGSRVLVEWQEAKKELLGGLLVRPDTHLAAHYTGIILKKGDGVDRFCHGVFLDYDDLDLILSDMHEHAGINEQNKCERPSCRLLRGFLKICNNNDESLNVGDRVFFEQFSGFEKYQSPDGSKRYAFVDEGAIMAKIPHRTKISTPYENFEE